MSLEHSSTRKARVVKPRKPRSVTQNGQNVLLPREATVVAELVKGVGVGAAHIAAGYAPTAAVHTRPRVQSALLQAMEAAGLTEGRLVKILAKGLKAKRQVYYRDGLVGEHPDHSSRHKFLTTALELRGDLGRRTEGGEESFEELLFQIRARRTAPRGD